MAIVVPSGETRGSNPPSLPVTWRRAPPVTETMSTPYGDTVDPTTSSRPDGVQDGRMAFAPLPMTDTPPTRVTVSSVQTPAFSCENAIVFPSGDHAGLSSTPVSF